MPFADGQQQSPAGADAPKNGPAPSRTTGELGTFAGTEHEPAATRDARARLRRSQQQAGVFVVALGMMLDDTATL
jgi:hypothetical protein